ncbi:MAG: PEP-CTERM sorting domain-containing protein [Syntrophobacteraceae bacterium]
MKKMLSGLMFIGLGLALVVALTSGAYAGSIDVSMYYNGTQIEAPTVPTVPVGGGYVSTGVVTLATGVTAQDIISPPPYTSGGSFVIGNHDSTINNTTGTTQTVKIVTQYTDYSVGGTGGGILSAADTPAFVGINGVITEYTSSLPAGVTVSTVWNLYATGADTTPLATVTLTGLGSGSDPFTGLSSSSSPPFGFDVVETETLTLAGTITSVNFYDNTTVTTPEPSIMLLFGSGLVGLAAFRRFKKA